MADPKYFEMIDVEQIPESKKSDEVLPFSNMTHSTMESLSHEFYIRHRSELERVSGDRKKELINNLILMGYDYEISECTLQLTFWRGIEQALDFLEFDESGLIGHPFFKVKHKKSSQSDYAPPLVNGPSLTLEMQEKEGETARRKCLLCGQPKSLHSTKIVFDLQGMIRRISSVERLRHQQTPTPMQIEADSNKIKCEVCYTLFEKEKMMGLKCEHLYCMDCMKTYLQTKVSMGYVQKITCIDPKCLVPFPRNIILQLLSQDDLERLDQLQELNQINSDPSLKWCPSPGCERYHRGIPGKKKKIKCECGYIFCFKCGNQWHGWKGCEQLIDEGYEKWAKGKNIQYCPVCGIRTNKIEGCNHITCPVCKYEWCWLCRGAYDGLHFSPGNPLGCPGGMFMRERSPCWKRWGRGFLSLLGLIGMCILVMLFAGHALLCALTLKNMRCRTKCSTFGAILIFLLLVLPFGTLLSAILIPFEIIIFIPVGLYYLFKNMLSQLVSSIRWHRRRTALQQELIVRNGLQFVIIIVVYWLIYVDDL